MDLVALIRSTTSYQPVYVVNEPLIRQHVQAYKNAFQQFYPKPTTVFYAAKAFLNLAMAKLIKQEDVSINVCSEGELFIAEKMGIPGAKILIHGNNKNDNELDAAVKAHVYAIVIESESEFDTLTKRFGTKTPGVMLRVNPSVHVDTHPAIATGVKYSKFGLPINDSRTLDLILELAKSEAVHFKGLQFHIGSQIVNFQAYTDAINNIVEYLAVLQASGVTIETLDCGGGLGVVDDEATVETIKRFAKHVAEAFVLACERYAVPLPDLIVEPGRSIVSQAGCTLYEVGYIKETDGINFLAVHGGMSDNIRVALYHAQYHACVANKMDQKPTKYYKVVGNCCESGDVLIEDIELPECATGDILAVFNTGAYSHSMASHYNKHLLPGVVFVRDNSYVWTTKQQTLEDLVRHDVVV